MNISRRMEVVLFRVSLSFCLFSLFPNSSRVSLLLFSSFLWILLNMCRSWISRSLSIFVVVATDGWISSIDSSFTPTNGLLLVFPIAFQMELTSPCFCSVFYWYIFQSLVLFCCLVDFDVQSFLILVLCIMMIFFCSNHRCVCLYQVF